MAILLPVTEAYAARAGLPLRSLLMPLSFAIFLGGNNSIIASRYPQTRDRPTARGRGPCLCVSR